MKKIKLTQGKYAIVDDIDYEWLSRYKWKFQKNGYAVRNQHICVLEGKQIQKAILMHRFIMNAKDESEVDHINGDRLDNRRNNLRLCSRLENRHNSQKHKDNTSGYKGVSWFKRDKKWRAFSYHDGKFIHLGYFEDKAVAAEAYNDYIKKIHGDFARLNLIK